MSPWIDRPRRVLRHTPLVGHALDCGYKEHWQSLLELIVGLFGSMLPIWVGTFVSFAKAGVFDWQHLHTAFSGTVIGGELFIYAAAFLAPIYWIILHDPPGAGEFPSSLAHGVLTAIVMVFAALSFELQRSGQITDPTVIHKLAIWFFWVALLLIYLATLYHNHRLPGRLPEVIREDQNQFLTEYRGHRP